MAPIDPTAAKAPPRSDSLSPQANAAATKPSSATKAAKAEGVYTTDSSSRGPAPASAPSVTAPAHAVANALPVPGGSRVEAPQVVLGRADTKKPESKAAEMSPETAARAAELKKGSGTEGSIAITATVAGVIGCIIAPPAGAALLAYAAYKGFKCYSKRQGAKDPEQYDNRKTPFEMQRDKAIKRGVESALCVSLGVGACFFGPAGIAAGVAMIGLGIKKGFDCKQAYDALRKADKPQPPTAEQPTTATEGAKASEFFAKAARFLS